MLLSLAVFATSPRSTTMHSAISRVVMGCRAVRRMDSTTQIISPRVDQSVGGRNTLNLIAYTTIANYSLRRVDMFEVRCQRSQAVMRSLYLACNFGPFLVELFHRIVCYMMASSYAGDYVCRRFGASAT